MSVFCVLNFFFFLSLVYFYLLCAVEDVVGLSAEHLRAGGELLVTLLTAGD